MNFADKATFNIIAKTAGSLLLMVSSIIMTRYLSKESYGSYLQAMLIVNTVVQLALVGVPQSIYYFFQLTAGKRSFIHRNICFSLAIGLAVAILLLVFGAPLCKAVGNPGLSRYLPYLAALVVLQAPLTVRDAIFFSSGAFLANSAGTLAFALADYVPLCLAVVAGCPVERLLLVYTVSKGATLTLYLLMVRRFCLKPLAERQPEEGGHEVKVIDQLRYALPICTAGYLAVLCAQADKYIVSSAFTPAEFAVYSRGAMEVPFISTLTYLLNDMTLPRYVAAYKEGKVGLLLDLMHRNIDKVAKINLAVFAFLMLEAPLLMEILYTERYAGATPVFRIYLLSLLFRVTVYNMIPTATGHTGLLLKSAVFSTAARIALCSIFLVWWGAVGVAAGVLLESFLVACYLLSCSVRIVKVPWSRIMPWRGVARIAFVAALSGVVTALCQQLFAGLGLTGNLATLLTSLAIFCYLDLLLLDGFGLLSGEDREFIKRWLRIDPFLFMPQLSRLRRSQGPLR